MTTSATVQNSPVDSTVIPNIEASIATVIDKLTVVASEVTSKIVDVAPDAAKLILTAIQITSLVDLLTTLVFCILPFLTYKYFVKRILKHGVEQDWRDEGVCFGAVMAVVGQAVISVMAISAFFSSKNSFIGAISPETLLVIKSLAAVGIKII